MKIESDSRSIRPATKKTSENIEHVRVLINQNCRLTMRQIEEVFGIPKTIVSRILNQNLGMSCVTAKFVLQLMTEDQQIYRADVIQENLEKIKNYPEMFKKVITSEKSWVYGYEPETKAQSSQWKTPEEY